MIAKAIEYIKRKYGGKKIEVVDPPQGYALGGRLDSKDIKEISEVLEWYFRQEPKGRP